MDHQRITIKDIAQACGVSVATVSYVLNDVKTQSISEETKKRVLHYANLVGYESSHSARALATGRTNAIGIYAPHSENAAGVHRLCCALTEEIERAGKCAHILGNRCLDHRITSIDAILAVDVSNREFRSIGESNFFPLLLLEGRIDDALFYSIYFDAHAIRARAIQASGRSRVVCAIEKPNSEPYARYLDSVYDAVMEPAAVLNEAMPENESTVIITQCAQTARICKARGAACLLLGSDELPLDYALFAARTVSICIDAMQRSAPPEHDVRIY